MILETMTTDEAKKLAATPNPLPQVGTWTLIAPDGRQWAADSPLRCITDEIESRVPPLVQLARIRCGVEGVDWHDDETV